MKPNTREEEKRRDREREKKNNRTRKVASGSPSLPPTVVGRNRSCSWTISNYRFSLGRSVPGTQKMSFAGCNLPGPKPEPSLAQLLLLPLLVLLQLRRLAKDTIRARAPHCGTNSCCELLSLSPSPWQHCVLSTFYSETSVGPTLRVCECVCRIVLLPAGTPLWHVWVCWLPQQPSSPLLLSRDHLLNGRRSVGLSMACRHGAYT